MSLLQIVAPMLVLRRKVDCGYWTTGCEGGDMDNIVKLSSEWVSEISVSGGYVQGLKLTGDGWYENPIASSRDVFLLPDIDKVIKIGLGGFESKQNWLEHKLYHLLEQDHKQWFPEVIAYKEHTVMLEGKEKLLNILVCKYVEIDRSKELTADQKLQIQFLSELYDLRDLLGAADSEASKEVDGNFGVGVDTG